jgi:hypothetical protein
MTIDPDTQCGLYRKYEVRKVKQEPDQRGEMVDVLVDPGECFVLNHNDPHAIGALRMYALTCKDQYPQLAKDLNAMADRWVEELRPS